MKVSVKTLKGKFFDPDVNPSDQVIDVKKKIETTQGKEAFPCAQQLLIHQGKVLKDETTLETNNVSENGFLVVMLTKSKASPTSSSTSAAAPEPTPAAAPSPPAATPVPSAPRGTPAPAPVTTPAPAPVATSTPAAGVAPPSDVYGQAASNLVAGTGLEQVIQQIMDMGSGTWDRDTVVRALHAAYNNPERAIEYLYSGIPETAELTVPAARPAPAAAAAAAAPPAVPAEQAPAGGPNAMPLDLFPQGMPVVGGGGAAGALDFLRSNPQVFSFKLRGAYNMMAKLSPAQLSKGVICSSAGNHAQGVALAARRLGCDAVIAMPVTTPEIKWMSVERLGATVVLVGDSYDEAQSYAKKRSQQEGRIFIPPFDNPEIIAGQGTVGMEIIRQHGGPLHAVFVPVGGGGLIAGIAAYIKRIRPEVKIIGVEPIDANAMALSLYHGERVLLEHCGGFDNGVAVKQVGEETFRLCRELIDGIVLVNRDAVCAAIKDMFEEKRSILEPAGALALAGAKAYCKYYGLQGETVVAITSGANMNFDRLRLVTELANVGARKEAVLAITMSEKPGTFKKLVDLIGHVNITELKYRYSDDQNALVLCSVRIHKEEEVQDLIKRIVASGLQVLDMTENDLVKDHLRHLMGGRAFVKDEILCRFIFPEKPGALKKFLDTFTPHWNISLFHYRSQGEEGGNVLIGIQVQKEEKERFVECAIALGYEFQEETSNEAFKLIMPTS